LFKNKKYSFPSLLKNPWFAAVPTLLLDARPLVDGVLVLPTIPASRL
jgi:hypothetical protein